MDIDQPGKTRRAREIDKRHARGNGSRARRTDRGDFTFLEHHHLVGQQFARANVEELAAAHGPCLGIRARRQQERENRDQSFHQLPLLSLMLERAANSMSSLPGRQPLPSSGSGPVSGLPT